MADRPDGALSSSTVPSDQTVASPSVVWQPEATRHALRPVRVIRPPAFSIATIITGVQTLVKYADLLWILSVFRLKVRYKQSALGWIWAALQPLALMTIYTIVFTRVTTVSTGGIPYPLFVLCALLPGYSFPRRSLMRCMGWFCTQIC